MIKNLPQVRGRYTENAPLGAKGWFRCGGMADVLFKPADIEDLQHFLKNYNPSPDFSRVGARGQSPSPLGRGKATEREQGEGNVHIFGALSNTIIRDGGVRGVVVRLGREFSNITIDKTQVIAGALALDANVASIAADHGLGGLEFLSGIPGSIGGAIKMNAGCYGTEIKDVLAAAHVLTHEGDLKILKPADLDMTYRHTNLPEGWIVTKVVLNGTQEKADDVKQRIAEIKERREQSQPIREKTGGSTFANPSADELSQAGLNTDMKVWQLIEGVGGRGLKIGGAMMSEKHCNFMINTGDATASDLENLGEEIKRRVLDKYGITLRWEIRRIGECSSTVIPSVAEGS